MGQVESATINGAPQEEVEVEDGGKEVGEDAVPVQLRRTSAASAARPASVKHPPSSSSTAPAPTSARYKRKSNSDVDQASQHSTSYTNLAGRAAWAPLSWASQGAELVATTTVSAAATTLSVAMKTTSVVASTTESAATLAAHNISHVSLKTASVASLITSATVKSAGEAIAGTATLVVEGLASSSPSHAQQQQQPATATAAAPTAASSSRFRAGSVSSSSSPPPTAPAAAAASSSPTSASTTATITTNVSPKIRPSSRSHESILFLQQQQQLADLPLLPEAMVALGGSLDGYSGEPPASSASSTRHLVGSRFWDMLGSTNESARRHWVATVTSTKTTPPSTKYFRKIVILAYESKGQSVDEFYKMLLGRPITTSAVCALKALITCLRLVREGPSEALVHSITNVQFVDWVGAFYAEKIFLDSAAAVPSSSAAASAAATPTVATTATGGAAANATATAPGGGDTLNEHMLIARLSGFIVQKMHFHARQMAEAAAAGSRRRGGGGAMNARYEREDVPSSDALPGGDSTGKKPAPLPPSALSTVVESAREEDDGDEAVTPVAHGETMRRPAAAGGSEDLAATVDEQDDDLEEEEEEEEDDGDEFERLVQLASSLLTLLGTIEGVTRLALSKPRQSSTPSPMALLLATLLIEESLGAFDCLSSTLSDITARATSQSDAVLVKSLSTRHQNAYEAIRLYCLRALEFPYVVALNKVPVLSKDRLGVVNARLSPSSSISPPPPPATATASTALPVPAVGTPSSAASSSSGGGGFSPWGLFGYATTSSSSSSSVAVPSPSKSVAAPKAAVAAAVPVSSSSFATNVDAPTTTATTSLLRPFTRISILEGLEEEEKLMDALVSNSASNLLATTTLSTSNNDLLSPSHTPFHSFGGAGGTGQSYVEQEDWGDLYSSIENAKPPIEFEAEDDDYHDEHDQDDPHDDHDDAEDAGSARYGMLLRRSDEEDAGSYDTADGGSYTADGGSYTRSPAPAHVRTTTQGNPFDTGNSSVILLAIAHRSAFSGITNPFASGQYTGGLAGGPSLFSTTASSSSSSLTKRQQQLLSQQQQSFAPHAAAAAASALTPQQRKEEEASRALQQCERLFEFSGINLPQEEVEISSEVIGRGAFSVVFRGKLASTGEEVAVKELNIEEWGATPRVVMDFRAEVALMKAVHHPNVLRLIGACTTPKLRLVSEYCHLGNLFDFLYFDRNAGASPTSSKVLTWPLRLRLALGEARGMHFLHTAFPVPLIHRDLKSLNLLLSRTFQLKVSDFGLSRFRARKTAGGGGGGGGGASRGGGPCGTTHWMAPEVIEGVDEYDEKADIYSFAVNLWELCTRRIPWDGEKDVKRRVVSGQRLALNDTVLDSNCPPALLDLIERCWHRDPRARPDFGVICKELKRISKTVAAANEPHHAQQQGRRSTNEAV